MDTSVVVSTSSEPMSVDISEVPHMDSVVAQTDILDNVAGINNGDDNAVGAECHAVGLPHGDGHVIDPKEYSWDDVAAQIAATATPDISEKQQEVIPEEIAGIHGSHVEPVQEPVVESNPVSEVQEVVEEYATDGAYSESVVQQDTVGIDDGALGDNFMIVDEVHEDTPAEDFGTIENNVEGEFHAHHIEDVNPEAPPVVEAAVYEMPTGEHTHVEEVHNVELAAGDPTNVEMADVEASVVEEIQQHLEMNDVEVTGVEAVSAETAVVETAEVEEPKPAVTDAGAESTNPANAEAHFETVDSEAGHSETISAEIVQTEVIDAEAPNPEAVSEDPEGPKIVETDADEEVQVEPTVEEPVSSYDGRVAPEAADEITMEVVEEPDTSTSEAIEISELKTDEDVSEELETVETIEFRVIEGDSGEVLEESSTIIEEHVPSGLEPEEEILLIHQSDSTEIDDVDTSVDTAEVFTQEVFVMEKEDDPLVDEVEEDVKDVVRESVKEAKETKIKKPRGRKPIDDIPLHVLGRDINKPGVNGGRTMPKPRLGVKVPYRNLTSQIVSKEEIQKEIMDRFKQKQEQTVNDAGDIMFSNRLTHRLAKKLLPGEKGDDKSSSSKDKVDEKSSSCSKTVAPEKKPASTETKPKPTPPPPARQVTKLADVSSSLIKNNSDLLAILEGDDDDLQESTPKQTENVKFVNAMEKELALQQLNELPLTTKNKIFKSRGPGQKREEKTPASDVKSSSSSKIDQKSAKVDAKAPKTESSSSSSKSSGTSSSGNKPKVDSSKVDSSKVDSTKVDSPKVSSTATKPPEKKTEVDIEPQIKSGMVLKTYTRKRKSFEPIEFLPKKSLLTPPQPVPRVATPVSEQESEDSNPATSNVYMTKSSRVIKKKVIWDPDDETSTKSPTYRSPKHTASTPKPVSTSTPTATTKQTPTVTAKQTAGSTTKGNVVATKAASPATFKGTVQSGTKGTPTSAARNTAVAASKIPAAVKTSSVISKQVEKKAEVEKKSAVKRPVSGSGKTPPSKKRLTEVDRLLMDEGAVNMLYDVNTADDPHQDKVKKKKDVISLDRAHRELMNKTNVIKNELQQQNAQGVDLPQKSLRKKEGSFVMASPAALARDPLALTNFRKKSRDSTNSSVRSPPMSPAYAPAEASRIIRRHSSSSFSSLNDLGDESDANEKAAKKKATTLEAKKKLKKVQAEAKKKPPVAAAAAAAKADKEVATAVADKEKEKVKTKEPVSDKTSDQYKNFVVKKSNKLVTITITYTDTKRYLTEQFLKELTSCLKELGKDDSCNAVLITSNDSKIFCNGVDYKSLVSNEEDVRKKRAMDLSSRIKEFVRCLLHFPKVLAAGIEGECKGLGVTMLPLFDMVIASDTSTFSTPYASLGCVAEAGFLLAVPHLSNHGLASELLYTSQVLKADDGFRRGLVTRLCWPEKYHEELNTMLKSIASQSKQSITATKSQLRQNIIQTTEASLNASVKVLVEHWTSSECQKNFAKL